MSERFEKTYLIGIVNKYASSRRSDIINYAPTEDAYP